MDRSQPYLVRTVTSQQELENLLNQSVQYGYRYRDTIPSTDPTMFGGSRTARLLVVLEHIDVARAVGGSPGASTP